MARQVLEDAKSIHDYYRENVDDAKLDLPVVDVMVIQYQIMFSDDSIFVKIGQKFFVHKDAAIFIDDALRFICTGPECKFDLKDVAAIPIEIVAVRQFYEMVAEIGFKYDGKVYALESHGDDMEHGMCKMLFFDKKMRKQTHKIVDECFITTDRIKRDPTLPVFDWKVHRSVCQYYEHIVIDEKESYELEFAKVRLADKGDRQQAMPKECKKAGDAKFSFCRGSGSSEIYLCIKVDDVFLPAKFFGGSYMSNFMFVLAAVSFLEQEYLEA